MNKELQKVKLKLQLLSLSDLKEILKKHDDWFLNWEEFLEERQKVNNEDSTSIINWIIGTDPIFVDGGLLDFINSI